MEDSDSVDPFGLLDGHTETEPDYPEDEALERLSRLKDRLQKASQWRSAYEEDWELSVQYLKGKQFRYRHIETGEVLYSNGLLEKNKFSMHNVLRPTHRQLVGKLSKLMPSFTVQPATGDYEEVQAAQVAEKFLQYLLHKLSINVKWLKGQNGVATLGNHAFSVVWDPEGGTRISVCPDPECGFEGDDDMADMPCPVCESDLAEAQVHAAEANAAQAAMQGPDVVPAAVPEMPEPPIMMAAFTGEVDMREHDIRRVFPQPEAETPEEIQYIFLEIPETVASLRQRFPEKAHLIGPTQALEGSQHNPNDPFGDVGYIDAESEDYVEDRTYLYEYHEVPTGAWPDGRIIYFTDQGILEETDSPYYKLYGRLPFFFIGWIRNLSELLCEGFISQAWHRQKELNTNESNIREHTELSTRRKLLVASNARVSPNEVNSRASSVIVHNPNAPLPQFLPMPGLPQEVYARRDMLTNDVRQLAGVTDAEAGITGSDPNGRHAAILEAENDAQMGPITTLNNEEWRLAHLAMLKLSQKYYGPDRQFNVAGDDSYGDTYAFGEMNLTAGYDLILEVEDGFARNRQVRFTEALQSFQSMAFGDPMSPEAQEAFRHASKIKVKNLGPDLKGPEYSAAREKLHQIENRQPFESFVPEEDPEVYATVFLHWLRTKGRKAEPDVRMLVRQVWGMYVEWAMTGQAPPPNEPGAQAPGMGSPADGEMSAPGGTPNGVAPTGPADSPQASDKIVAQADATAEQATADQGI